VAQPGRPAVGFEHVIANRPRRRLRPDAARAIAAEFLARQSGRARRCRSQCRSGPTGMTRLHVEQETAVKDGRYRRTVIVHGDRVGKFRNSFTCRRSAARLRALR